MRETGCCVSLCMNLSSLTSLHLSGSSMHAWVQPSMCRSCCWDSRARRSRVCGRPGRQGVWTSSSSAAAVTGYDARVFCRCAEQAQPPSTLHVCLHTLCTCLCCVSHRFYETDSSIKIGMMEAFKKLAVDPESLPDIIFASIGRTTWKVCACVRVCVCRTHVALCRTVTALATPFQSEPLTAQHRTTRLKSGVQAGLVLLLLGLQT